MSEDLDNVSDIHKRWSLTRINFSSYKISLIISLTSSFVIISLTGIYFDQDFLHIFIYLTFGLCFVLTSYFMDFYLLQGSPVNNFSKILHVSAFSNLLWMTILIFGIMSYIIFKKDGIPSGYIIEGMMLAIGLRIGIFTSVFGAELKKAILVGIIQPIILVSIITPLDYFTYLTKPLDISFGLIIIGLGIAWAIFANRSGRPNIESTFSILQAFLSAWTENKVKDIEKILVSKSIETSVFTRILRFKDDGKEINLILPEIHPGPFKSIGGSNLSHRLWKYFNYKAIVFHTPSDHSVNIPSYEEVLKYLKSLSIYDIIQNGNTCSLPLKTRNGDVTCTGIAFGDIPLIMLSNSPSGMDDIPEVLQVDLERYSKSIGFKQILMVDSHNAMGRKLNEIEYNKMLDTAKKCLEKLQNSLQTNFKVSIANSREIFNNLNYIDVGKAGLSIFLIEILNRRYVLGWTDSNNMKNGLREHIISKLEQKGVYVLDICTSDTHENSGFRTSEGYYPLGEVTSFEEITNIFIQLLSVAENNLIDAKYQIIETKSVVKVMGRNQFTDYSKALNKSMNLTKVFLGVTFIVIVLMLIFTT